SAEGYRTIFNQEATDNAYMVNLKNSSLENTEDQAAKFMDLSGVKGVVQNTTLTNEISVIVDSLDQIMTVLIIIAVLLGVVILYIYQDTILLTILGILVGFGIGEWLHQFIITVVPPEDVMFNPALSISSFIIPTVVISIVTLILGFVINRRLKNVDMLEALKS